MIVDIRSLYGAMVQEFHVNSLNSGWLTHTITGSFHANSLANYSKVSVTFLVYIGYRKACLGTRDLFALSLCTVLEGLRGNYPVRGDNQGTLN